MALVARIYLRNWSFVRRNGEYAPPTAQDIRIAGVEGTLINRTFGIKEIIGGLAFINRSRETCELVGPPAEDYRRWLGEKKLTLDLTNPLQFRKS